MRTISCTSAARCGNTTESGGWFSIHVVVLACCPRTAAEVTRGCRRRPPVRRLRLLWPCRPALPGRQRASIPSRRPVRRLECTTWLADRNAAVNDIKRSRSAPQRYEHGDALAIAPILVAELGDQIAFFQEDADKDVCGRDGGEEKVPCRHHRRRPESDDEAEIDRMPHQPVQNRRFEVRLRHGVPDQMKGHLLQPEQLEMVDQERAGQDDQPASE